MAKALTGYGMLFGRRSDGIADLRRSRVENDLDSIRSEITARFQKIIRYGSLHLPLTAA